jgi:hypothetical protein
MSIPASNLVTGETYEVLRRGETKAIGKFTGKREGILGNPVINVGDVETAFSAAQYSFKKAVKGGRRKTRRNCRRSRSSRSSR